MLLRARLPHKKQGGEGENEGQKEAGFVHVYITV
jgi:hypothetical protein